MSLANAANYLAAHGRNGDSMLVHMSPDEVQNLNAFGQQHGVSMTINPVTGLPEAGMFKKLFRAIAPVALGAALTPALGPWGAALAVGAFSTGREMKVYNKKFGDSLGQGFMDGLAAWSGANAMQAWSKLGEQAAAQKVGSDVAQEVAEEVAEQGAQQGITHTTADAGVYKTLAQHAGAPTSPLPTPTLSTTVPEPTFSGLPATGLQDLRPVTLPVSSAVTAPGGALQSTAAPASSFFQTAGYAAANPKAIIPALGGGTAAATTGVGIAAPIMTALAEEPVGPQLPAEADARYKAYRYKGGNIGRQRRDLAEYYASYNPDVARPAPLYYTYGTDYGKLEEYVPGAAHGGLMAAHGSLGAYSDGGRLLRGPGDGVSDDIPASINGDQPARLADGEFVVPARAVSELGNGSTDAGARKLYAMLNRLEASSRKAKRGQDMRPERYLPA